MTEPRKTSFLAPANERKPRRRWVAIIAAAISAAVTTTTESVVLGDTIGELLARAVDGLL